LRGERKVGKCRNKLQIAGNSRDKAKATPLETYAGPTDGTIPYAEDDRIKGREKRKRGENEGGETMGSNLKPEKGGAE